MTPEMVKPTPLSALPQDKQKAGSLPEGVSVQVNPVETRTEHRTVVGGAETTNAFTRRAGPPEDPSIQLANAHARHLSENIICYATYIPSNAKDAGGVYDFATQDGGRLRHINPGESTPIYFKQDVETLRRASVIRLSEKPLRHGIVSKECELASMPYAELVEMSRSLGVLDRLKNRTKGSLVNACLVAEFGAEEVERHTKSIYAA